MAAPPSRSEYPPEAAQVQGLIAHGKIKVAVERAKDVHKRYNTAASETLLVDAYGARIAALFDSNLPVEARSLLALVRERHPASAGRLEEVEWRTEAREGKLDFLAALCEPSLSEERRVRIESVVRREVISLEAVARCQALPGEHPLRVAAGALAKAFAAATGGPVSEEALALPEVSRRSPLAPWKPLTLAIAALYRRDHDACRRYAEAIEPASAPARLKPVLLSLMDGKFSPLLASGELPGQARLAARVSGNLGFLRGLLRETDKIIERARSEGKPGRALPVARETLRVCGESLPEFVSELREHLVVRLGAAGVHPPQAVAALGPVSAESPNYFRLLAQAYEGLNPDSDPLTACGLWEEFRRRGLRQHWFAEKSPECGALYLHMASLVDPIPGEELAALRRQAAKRIASGAGVSPSGEPLATYYADPREVYSRACASDPHTEAFERWLDWEKRNGNPRQAEEAAELWRRALPSDVPPLVYLMDATEARGALQKSLGYIAQAEALDGLNAEVRRARLRLLFRSAVRSLKDRRPHLAEGHLTSMAALAEFQQGQRPALLAVLQWACAGLSGRLEEAATRLGDLCASLGPTACTLLQWNVARMCQWKEGWPDLAVRARREDLAAAAARVCALGDDIGVEFEIPFEWIEQIARALSKQGPGLETPQLLSLGEAALRRGNSQLAYAASVAGLARGGTAEARFLFIRARSLPEPEYERRNQCLAAVVELARRQRDMGLVSEAIEERQGKRPRGRRRRRWLDEEPLDQSDLAISQEHLTALLEQERAARSYPASPGDEPRYVAQFAAACNCAACRAMRGEPVYDEEPGPLPPIPREALKELEQLFYTMDPEEAMTAVMELASSLGIPPEALPLPGRKKRRRRYEEEDPF